MLLVKDEAPQIPISTVHGSSFEYRDGVPVHGELEMDFIPGRTLKAVWAKLDDARKDQVCKEIWDLVTQIRAISHPKDLGANLHRTVDGSPSQDPLLGGGGRYSSKRTRR